ncbi:SOS response-associated peptidase family protein [Stutzerimonas stutzeri]|uniref:SOS response-associated peptidase family protein n=1 Tax=Stutzerimonas stutzeri TaxID=316 RepID=UPI0022DCF3AA|nr:SOS response-associated peptidase family protein [Stutzerimonas stutzeri]WBL61910.1 SOS response-associated peptidase family protein [Stutzerimonas stutzeri]
MCGRFAQYRIAYEYLDKIAVQLPLPLRGSVNPEPIGRYNVCPQSMVQLLHQDDDGLRMEPVKWGYAPLWAQGKRPPAINARVETAATSRFFRDIWQIGRATVPADGWYEWKKDAENPKIKQPYYITLRSGEPMFFAALGRFQRGGSLEPRDGDGFVVITSSSDAGMLDIHDRRPLVLSPQYAARWIDPHLPPHEAEKLALEHGLCVEEFEWHPVGKAVGNVRNDGPELIDQIAHPLL